MVSLGVVLLVTARTGSYALAGAMSASFALSGASIGPFGARLVDRFGQARVVPLLAAGEVIFLLAFVAAAVGDRPAPLQFLLLILSGGLAPNVGACVRSRWANLLSGTPEVRPAFSLEAVIDEMVFIVGPPLVTWLCVQVNPASGVIAAAALVAVGTGWLSAQRRTQPPPLVHRRERGQRGLLGGAMVAVTALMLLLGGVFGSFEVTTVAFAESRGAESLTGLVLAIYAAGSLTSGLAIGAIRVTGSHGRQLLGYSLVLALVTAPFAFVGSLQVLSVVAFLAGMTVSPVLITAATLVESAVPAARLTEALTLTVSGLAVGLAMGSTTSGVLVDRFQPSVGYVVMSACAALAFLVVAATFRILTREPHGEQHGSVVHTWVDVNRSEEA